MKNQHCNTMIAEGITAMSLVDARNYVKHDFKRDSLSCIIHTLQSWVVLLILADSFLADQAEERLMGIHPSLDFSIIEAKLLFDQSKLMNNNDLSNIDDHSPLISSASITNDLHYSLDLIAQALIFGLEAAISDGYWKKDHDFVDSHQLGFQ